MGAFTVIPESTFNELQMDAGVLLNSTFDPDAGTITDAMIICATSGGINPSCVAQYSDLGDDIDNCPVNVKQLKHLDGWTATLSFTTVSVGVDAIKLALGAADVSGTTVTPRNSVAQSDFRDLYWVGDRTDGGYAAIKLMNALSTSGLSLQTTKSGKGKIAVTLTGHYSITDQDVVPMVFYSTQPSGGNTTGGNTTGGN